MILETIESKYGRAEIHSSYSGYYFQFYYPSGMPGIKSDVKGRIEDVREDLDIYIEGFRGLNG